MAEIQLLGDLALSGALVMGKNEASFPLNPRIGTIIIKDQCLFAYIKIGGLETWYPFANKTNSYIHSQGLASSTWTVTHNLGTTDVWIQVKDSDGNIIYVAKQDVNENTFTLNFTTEITGTVVVVAPDTVNVPEVKSSLINVADVVVIDSSGVMINGSYALTSANIQSQIDTAIAGVIDGAPSSLNTLNKIAAAINDDPNFYSSVVTALGTKADKITTYTKNEVNTALALKQDTLTFSGSNGVSASESSGTVSISLTNTGVSAGTYGSSTKIAAFTVDVKGRVTTVSEITAAPAFSSITSKPTTLSGYGITDAVSSSLLGANNGVATLDSFGKVPASQLPSYVDDVLEYANLAAFPATGETDKIYVAKDTNKIYRWSGSLYIEISATAGNSDTASKLQTARNISATGDASWSVSFDGSADASAALTLANSGVTAGTYKSVTVDAKGRVTSASNPTTLAGFGITDAQASDSKLTSISALSNSTTGFIKLTNGVASLDDSPSISAVTSVSFGSTGLTPATTTTGSIIVGGTLSTANGGTGLTGFTAGGILYASSSQNIGTGTNLTFDGSTLAVDGSISHKGLSFTEGTGIDQIKTITKSLTLTTDWQDTGIAGDNLTTGTYIVQLFANDSSGGGTNNNEYYSGMMSWYAGSTNSSLDMPTDEIQLHRAGAGGEGALYLRTYRTANGSLKLQVYSNTANASSSNYVFKFRRVI